MNLLEYPKGHWKIIRSNYYQFVNSELPDVYGIVELHDNIPDRYYEWYYCARVCNNARKTDLKPIDGYAPSLDSAKKIVEAILSIVPPPAPPAPDGYDKFGDATVKIVKLRLSLVELIEWLENAPIIYANGNVAQGADDRKYYGWKAHKELVEKARATLKETAS